MRVVVGQSRGGHQEACNAGKQNRTLRRETRIHRILPCVVVLVSQGPIESGPGALLLRRQVSTFQFSFAIGFDNSADYRRRYSYASSARSAAACATMACSGDR